MRVHLFTAVQFACLVGLWVVKDIKQTSILFPVMLVVMMGVRKLLDRVFEKSELKILDDILPEFKRHETLDDEEALELGKNFSHGLKSIMQISDGMIKDAGGQIGGQTPRRASLRVTSGGIAVPMANGNIMMIPVPEVEECGDNAYQPSGGASINITEQINSSGMWTSLEGNTSTSNKKDKKESSSKKKNQSGGKQRMSPVEENEDEEQGGITIKIDRPKSIKEPGSCEEHASLVKHSDANGTNV